MGEEPAGRPADRGAGPQPQPEHAEPRLPPDAGLTDLSRRDWVAIAKRSAREFLDDQVTDMGAALAFYSFLAIPAALLLTLGILTLVLSRDAVDRLMQDLSTVVPSEVTTLLGDSLNRIDAGGGAALVGVGSLLALWTTTGAMTAFMRALNRAYERGETRGFVRRRLTALAMVLILVLALVLVVGLLVLGPILSQEVGEAVGQERVVTTLWWVLQWPILILGLLAAFATLLYLGPDVDHPRWRFLTPGAVAAVIVWLLVSGLLAVYTSMFGSYNKTWGSISAVVVTLVWLWLSANALLIGAELNAEAERSRELRQGEPAGEELQAPPQTA